MTVVTTVCGFYWVRDLACDLVCVSSFFSSDTDTESSYGMHHGSGWFGSVWVGLWGGILSGIARMIWDFPTERERELPWTPLNSSRVISNFEVFFFNTCKRE